MRCNDMQRDDAHKIEMFAGVALAGLLSGEAGKAALTEVRGQASYDSKAIERLVKLAWRIGAAMQEHQPRPEGTEAETPTPVE